MRVSSLITALVVAFGIASWLAGLFVNMHIACVAYHSTPDLPNFASRAMGLNVGHQDKSTYLFEASVMTLVAGILLLVIRESWLEKQRRFGLHLLRSVVLRAVLVGVVGWSMLGGTQENANRAIALAHELHWYGKPAPNRLVDNVCVPFEGGMFWK